MGIVASQEMLLEGWSSTRRCEGVFGSPMRERKIAHRLAVIDKIYSFTANQKRY